MSHFWDTHHTNSKINTSRARTSCTAPVAWPAKGFSAPSKVVGLRLDAENIRKRTRTATWNMKGCCSAQQPENWVPPHPQQQSSLFGSIFRRENTGFFLRLNASLSGRQPVIKSDWDEAELIGRVIFRQKLSESHIVTNKRLLRPYIEEGFW